MFQRFVFPAILSASVFVHSAAFAQTAEEVFENYYKSWYQVELIIFERVERQDADPEAWGTDQVLSYPESNLAFLVDPKSVSESQDDLNPVTNDLNTRASGDNAALLASLKNGDTNDPLTKKITERIERSETNRFTPDEPPYVLLDDDNLTLLDVARRIGRDRNMRLLFHKAWRQPMAARGESPAIVVVGGDEYANHFELEGTVTFSLERYLHIHTDLWLARFEANIGQLTEAWPFLPKRPEAPKDDIASINDTDLDTTNFDDLDNSQVGIQQGFESPGTLNLQGTGNLNGTSPNSDYFSFSPELAGQEFGETSFGDTASQPFVVTQLVTLVQNRRMRSKELHYIDHPKLGILVRITPYKPEFVAPNNSVETSLSSGAY